MVLCLLETERIIRNKKPFVVNTQCISVMWYERILNACSFNFSSWWRLWIAQNPTIFDVWSQIIFLNLPFLRMSTSFINYVVGWVDCTLSMFELQSIFCNSYSKFFLLFIQGVLEAIRISCAGYPTNKSFVDFVKRFGLLVPEVLRAK